MRMSFVLLCAAALLSVGCACDQRTGADAGVHDSGTTPAADAGDVDAGARDSGAGDAGADSGLFDAGLDGGVAVDASVPPGACVPDLVVNFRAGILVGSDLAFDGDRFVMAGWGSPDTSGGEVGGWLWPVSRDGASGTETWTDPSLNGTTIDGIVLEGDQITFAGTGRFAPGYSDGWIGRTTTAATTTLRQLGGDNQDWFHAIISAPSGYLAVGYTGTSTNTSWIVRLDSSGAPTWNRTYESAGWGELFDVISLAGGGYAAVGCDRPLGDARLMIFDDAGTPSVDRRYDLDDAGGWDQARRVRQLAGGDLIITGFGVGGSWADSNGWVARTRLDGEIVWQHLFPISGTDIQITALAILPDGRIALAASAWVDNSGTGVHTWLLDSSGAFLDEDAFGTTDHVVDAEPTADGFALFGDYKNSEGAFRGGAWLRTWTCDTGPI
jgi:hypothetical protein